MGEICSAPGAVWRDVAPSTKWYGFHGHRQILDCQAWHMGTHMRIYPHVNRVCLTFKINFGAGPESHPPRPGKFDVAKLDGTIIWKNTISRVPIVRCLRMVSLESLPLKSERCCWSFRH
jgi:hypothetical protein